MRFTIAALLSMFLISPVWAQAGDEASAADETYAAEEIDREPVKCISPSRIRSTEIIDDRTIVFHMRGGAVYRNQLAFNCPRLMAEKRFSYDLHINRLCDTDYVTVLEYWGTTLREGPSCGLGLFYPITREEAELLSAEPEEMLEAAGAVTETVESAGEAERRDAVTGEADPAE